VPADAPRSVEFPPAGQKDEKTSSLRGQCPLNAPDHLIFQNFPAPQIDSPDWKCPSLTFDNRCIAKQVCNCSTIQGRRHNQEAKVVPKHQLGVPGQGETQIGFQTSFVEFIKYDHPDTSQARIIKNHPAEDPLGHHLNPGPR